MVSTSSTAAQAREMEKKRKQTLERAKANHLSRQLQMRLQYARLKVEHGWQKQNLNEVENLYFHHSHQRGPKPYPPSSSFLTVTQNDPSSFSSPSKLSETSYRIWLHSLSRSTTMDTLLDASSNRDGAAAANSSSGATPVSLLSQTPTALQSTSNVTSTPLTPPEVQSSEVLHHAHLQQTPTQPLSNLPLQTGNPPVDNSAMTSLLSTNATGSSTILSDALLYPISSQVQVSTGPSHTNSTAITSTPVSATKLKKPSNRTQSSHKTATPLTSNDMFNFSASSLTYDSFWSGLQSKSYPGLKGTAGTLIGAPITPPILPSGLPPTGAPSPSPSSNTHPTSIPTSTTPTSAPNSLPASITAPTPGPTLITNGTVQDQNPFFTGDLGSWNLIPTSLLSNPAMFPLLANLSASYNVSGSQAPIINVGANTGDVGTTTPTPQTPVPAPAPAIVTAFVGQQES